MKRSHNLQVRLTKREQAVIRAAAGVAGYERVAEWVRRVLNREAAELARRVEEGA